MLANIRVVPHLQIQMKIISILAKAVEKKMKRLHQLVTLCAFILGCGAGASALAAGEPTGVAKAALEKDAVCTACHNESWPTPVLSIYQTKMGVRGDPRTPGCRDCHGPSENHLKTPVNPVDVYFGAIKPAALQSETWPKTPSSAEARNGACLACHKGTARTQWDGSQHQINEVTCTNCHNVHAPQQTVLNRKTQTQVCFTCHKDQRADSMKISHHPIAEAKVVCSDCHNPHGSAGPTLLKKNTVNETCYMCHAEKRGPMLWEHQPVAENCVNCHTPHGSNISPLLMTRAPFMCQQCHDGPHNSKTPYAGSVGGIQNGLRGTATAPANPGSNQMGRACQNCHIMVHGSNSPAGALLQR
jgi:DmsE family decaheme c-type cytochrome